MESILEQFVGVVVSIASTCSIFLFIGGIFYFLIRGKNQEKAKKSDLRKKGVTDPAIIISAKRGRSRSGFASINNGTEMLITFEVNVEPKSWPPFSITFKDWVEVSKSEANLRGYRTQDVGKKIWVTYDPNDTSQMIFEYYDKDRKRALGYPIFKKMDKRNEVILKTGEEAVADILEIEDLEITNTIEREHLKITIVRMKFMVQPLGDSPYEAETQVAIRTSSLPKYAVGKQAIVKFNPNDKSQVSLVGAAEDKK